MRPSEEAPGVLVWGADGIDDAAIDQAARAASLPFVEGHVALMPDAHVGKGSTVGSVIPTQGAVIPAAVGVDIGCGMIAVETSLTSASLPDSLDGLFDEIARRIPAGLGKDFRGEGDTHEPGQRWLADHYPEERVDPLDAAQERTVRDQFGTLGSGNHFVEVSLDEDDAVWLVVHSGSRGIGNQLAQHHISEARGLMEQYFIDLPDPDLAYLVEETAEFRAYITDMTWAQEYAFDNRAEMMRNLVIALANATGGTAAELAVETINCHHNYTARENHHGRSLWITRKGAIRARTDDRGVVPGSMGTATYIVSGRGNAASWESSAHGAGRRMSRRQAKKRLDVPGLAEAMGSRTWNRRDAGELVDEHPESYKRIDDVMAAQRDLVEVTHRLRSVLNYKGT